MRKLPLTQGKYALVDNHWYALLSKWGWYYNDGYAAHKGENGKHILMHRVIVNAPKGLFVDHINGDTLDNRRENLRLSNHSTNAMNMRKHKGVSRYKGVCKDGNSWRVQIWKGNKRAFTALTQNERHAAMIYDLNAPALFGEYARLNFPEATLVSLE
jgi:hypothetical protein